MLVIAGLTDHCCHLIVKTKHYAIKKLLRKQSTTKNNSSSGHNQNYNSYDTPHDSGLDEDEGDDTPFVPQTSSVNSDEEDIMSESLTERHEHVVRNMMYGDVGKLCYGKYGVGVVNFFIAVTQFGFCVAYFIFIGNTVHTLFPVEKCYIPHANGTQQCIKVYNTSIDLHAKLQPRAFSTSESLLGVHLLNNVSSTHIHLESLNDSASNSTLTDTGGADMTTQEVFTLTTSPGDFTTANPTTNNITTTTGNVTTTTARPFYPMYEFIETAPDLKILVACPLVIFILFSLIRNVRYLGVISVLANLSILGGCASVFIFLLIGE